MAHRKRRLDVVTDTSSWGVLVFPDGFVGPVARGGGTLDLFCGTCDRLLVKGAAGPGAPNLANAVIECPRCKSFNVYPGDV